MSQITQKEIDMLPPPPKEWYEEEIIEGEIILYDIMMKAKKSQKKEVRIDLEKLKPNDLFLMTDIIGTLHEVRLYQLVRKTPKMYVINHINLKKELCYETFEYSRILDRNFLREKKVLTRKMPKKVYKIGTIWNTKDIIIKIKDWSQPKNYIYWERGVKSSHFVI